MPRPLNGGRTLPLTPAAWDVLLLAARRAPVRLTDVNPGVRNRLRRGDGSDGAQPFVEIVTDADGGRVLKLTDAGRALVATRDDTCTSCARKPGEVNHPRGAIFVGWGRGWEHCPVCGGTTRVAPTEPTGGVKAVS